MASTASGFLESLRSKVTHRLELLGLADATSVKGHPGLLGLLGLPLREPRGRARSAVALTHSLERTLNTCERRKGQVSACSSMLRYVSALHSFRKGM